MKVELKTYLAGVDYYPPLSDYEVGQELLQFRKENTQLYQEGRFGDRSFPGGYIAWANRLKEEVQTKTPHLVLLFGSSKGPELDVAFMLKIQEPEELSLHVNQKTKVENMKDYLYSTTNGIA